MAAAVSFTPELQVLIPVATTAHAACRLRRVESVIRWIERAVLDDADILIASDYDGTLAEIVDRPETVALPEVARASLRALAGAPRTHVAIISGRTLSDLAPRIGDLGPVWVSSDHGSVVVDPRHRVHVLGDEAVPERHTGLQRRAEDVARAFAGARVEIKPRSIAVHFRAVAAESHGTIAELFAAACVAEGARILYGRKVIEGQLGGGDKGAALRFIAQNLPPRTAVMYAGDDATDEPALRYAHEATLGLALFVQSAERTASRVAVHPHLSGPGEWHERLAALARLRTADERLSPRACRS